MGGKKPQNILGMFEISPNDIDLEWDDILEKVADVLKQFKAVIESYKIEPIAFGLTKAICRIRQPAEIDGGTQPLEDAITALENVQRAECTMVSLV